MRSVSKSKDFKQAPTSKPRNKSPSSSKKIQSFTRPIYESYSS